MVGSGDFPEDGARVVSVDLARVAYGDVAVDLAVEDFTEERRESGPGI